jgi:3-(3-hydroxy-phenyl)propionate hydroxylase
LKLLWVSRHDVVNRAANLLRVLNGEEDEGALDRYLRQRRHMAVEHVQTATIANKKNMERRDPQTRQKYREEMKRAGEDPLLAKNFLMRTSLIECLRDAGRVQQPHQFL